MSSAIPCTVMLPRAESPESVGVDSKVLAEYIDNIEKNKFRFDSLMIFRHGKVAAEYYWRPYTENTFHDMYSFSKTVTATAVGFAIDEGLLSLDTKVYSFFPEKYAKLTGKEKERADKQTIHSLLSMRSGKNISLFADKEKNDWTDMYMDTKFSCDPDKKWGYISENIYMLAKIVSIVSGMTVTEYLTPRLYEPLEMGVPRWEGDHDGIESGGWGIQMSTEQMAKFTLVYLQDGMWNGKQVLPKSWLDVCQKSHIAKVPCVIHDGTSYGYQMWLNNNPKYVRFDGLFGQISVIFPEYDAFVMFNASDPREYEFIKDIFNFFPRGFIDSTSEKSAEELAQYRRDSIRKCYDWSEATPRNDKMEKLVDGKKINLKIRDNISALGIMTYFTWSKHAGRMEYCKFDFKSETPKFIWKEKNSEENSIDIGFDGDFAISEATIADVKFDMAVQGNWIGDKLKLNIRPLGRTQRREMIFKFTKNGAKIKSNALPNLGELLVFYAYFSGFKIPNAIRSLIVNHVIKIANAVWMDPDAKGKFEK